MPRAVAMIRRFEIRKTTTQKHYGLVRLGLGGDRRAEEIDAKIWDWDVLIGRGLPELRPLDVVEVEFQEETYQGRPQWIVRDWRVLQGEEREQALPAFVPPRRTDDAYSRRFDELLGRTDPARPSGQIARAIFGRPGFREVFESAPAARDHHQNYPGGLLEHTVNVTTAALALADAYAHGGLTFNGMALPIDRPLLVAAGLLHDIGKVETYRMEPMVEVTDAHRWEGHLAIGYAMVREAARALPGGVPAAGPIRDEVDKLLHCLLAHHGQLEFGSPVAPACVEAFLLAQADLTDARLASMARAGDEALEREPGARWARGAVHFRDGFFVGDWPARRERTRESDA